MMIRKAPFGWRPGAVSKRLLRQLKKAKLMASEAPVPKPQKKAKKRTEDKPTLIVAKRNGEYIVEMQAYDDTEGGDRCKPLIYKIASADNDEKVMKRELKAQRLIEKSYKEVWSDPYHPEICEKTCLKAYKQAMGLLPFNPNDPNCICPQDTEAGDSVEVESNSEEISEDSSDGGSLDLDWEMHFSPPVAAQSQIIQ